MESPDTEVVVASPMADQPGRLWRWLRAGVGVVVLAALLHQVGDRRMLEQVMNLGWRVPLVFVPFGLFVILDVMGWRRAFPRRSVAPPLRDLYAIRLAGETVNDFTPSASVGGEPVKALLLRDRGVSMTDAVASLIIGKTTLTAAQILFIVCGLALLALRFYPSWRAALAVAVIAIASYVFVRVVVHWQRRGLLGSTTRWLQKITGSSGRLQRLAERGQDVDYEIAAFYEHQRSDFWASLSLHFTSWVFDGAELGVLLWLLGHAVDWPAVLMVEALIQPVKAAALVVPAGLGVVDAGGVLAFTLVGYEPGLGLAVMLLRRLREVVYGVLGLVLLRLMWRPASIAPSRSASRAAARRT
jgi:uncharacterized protein (TIRG00374 family)